MFKTGTPVTGKDFIDRKEHLPLFKAYIDNDQNIMIKAPRRFGKTSIVKHLLEDKEEYSFVYIDVKIASNLKGLSDKIIDKAYELSGINGFLYKAKDSLLSLIKSIQSLKIDITDIAETTIKFHEKENIDEVAYYLHALDLLNDIATKKNINAKVAFDEFQDILKIADKDILDKTRSVMQHHKNVTYIFMGSIESIMTQIFENKSSPFYHFAKIIELPKLDIDELNDYAFAVFETLKVDCGELKTYIEFLGGHPDYTMQFLQRLYINVLAYKVKKFDALYLKETMINVIMDNKAYIDELITKAKQRKHHLDVLSALAKNEKLQLDGKALYNIRNSLEDMGLVKHVKQGEYKINDIFLEMILRYDNDIDVEKIEIN